ncbi:signal recognition particle-docking protein FtsY [Nicoliella lavandulae]|uniref:Signal recognition particle receptor FtsY n=1 Tax=Nicoliella lavandulae TaxID=3082954 RepID=A0ABU8SL34_9LACO
MGLFDIFKRRNKKNKSAAPQSTESSAVSSSDDQVDASKVAASESTAPTSESNVEASSTSSNAPSSEPASSETSQGSETNSSSSVESQSTSAESSVQASSTSVERESVASESSAPVSESASAESISSEGESDSALASSDADRNAESTEASASASNDNEQLAESDAEQTDHDETDNDQATDAEPDNNDEPETQKYEHGLAKSRSSFGQKLNQLFANFRSVDEDFFDDLEDTLIESDVGYEVAVNLSDQLRDEVKLRNVKSRSEVQNVVVQKLIELYDQNGNGEKSTINFAKEGPTVILFVGVNGVGKTTTIGKMAKLYHDQGKKVLLAAADTFRAGAIQQLDVWAKRDGVDIVKKPEKSDPASVVFEAVQKAKKEQYDVLFVDTAGRLQNKVNLMNELSKMKKILTREIPMAPHEVMLVLDATTGQNALNQAKLFKQVTDVTGITLTKLDGTAKGGIVLAIRNELHIPVKYVGLGEKVGDLQPFNANDFVYGLFKGLLK